MSELFLTVVNMSISASWIVLAVLVLRLLLKKAPKWIAVLLWAVVAIRLICPVTVESVMSLIPSAETVNPEIMLEDTPEVHTGISYFNNAVNPVISEATVEVAPEKSVNILHVLTPIFTGVWLVGMGAMLVYTAVSYWRVKRMIGTAVRLRDNIYQSETVVSPFVLGILRPKIYLPFAISEQDMAHVLAHEQAHIRRRDYLWKPLGFLLLTVHWFNPLLWLGYVLLCRDIELACDEKVVKGLDREQRADYSQALLTCSVNRRVIAACPLAFGEISVKNRVKSVLNYKKPAFWVILVAIVACVAVAICFLTNPVNQSDRILGKLSNLEDYEVIEQDTQQITLSVPVSALPEDIFSEKGYQFGENELVAYQDDTAAIYLKEARYSNEGTDNLYFCFDFTFDLPKQQGKTIYPFEFLDDGGSPAVNVVDGVLRADNGAFEHAVLFRGQGSGELIWFYVSADALRQAQGTVSFDISINQITYFLDGDDYSKASDVSSSRRPTQVITDIQEDTRFSPWIDTATFDIDADGIDEQCTLGYGPTSGLFTITLRVQENGENEYFNIYLMDVGTLSFDETDAGMKLRLVTQMEGQEIYYSFSVRDGNIVLTNHGEEAAYWGEQGVGSSWSGIQMAEDGTIISATSYPTYQEVYEQTPADQVAENYDKGEFVIIKTHYQMEDGTWAADGYAYKYRLEVTGRMRASEKSCTYIILSNRENITFDEAWKASGISSNLNDYFALGDAVIVGNKLF